MGYSTKPKYRNYVKKYCFLSFAGKFGYKYVKMLMDTARKIGIDATKTASKWIVQKTVEATVELIRNKKLIKLLPRVKQKVKKKKMKDKKSTYHQKKDSKLLMN